MIRKLLAGVNYPIDRFASDRSHAATWSARCSARPGVPEAVVFVNLMRLSMSALRSGVASHRYPAILQVAGGPQLARVSVAKVSYQ
jgi:hypothetical protein